MKTLLSTSLLLFSFFMLNGQQLQSVSGYDEPFQASSGDFFELNSQTSTLYFTSKNENADKLLWKLPPSTEEPILIKTFDKEDGQYFYKEKGVYLNNVLYFLYGDYTNPTIWKSDGTENGTELFKDIVTKKLVATSHHLFFLVRDEISNDYKLWVSDGTTANTYPLNVSLAYSSAYWRYIPYQDGLVFTNGEGVLYFINAALEISEMATLPYESIGKLQVLSSSNQIMFKAASNQEVWMIDDTSTPILLASLTSSSVPFNRFSSDFAEHDGNLYFFQKDIDGILLWISQGTPATTKILKTFDISPHSTTFNGFKTLANEILFSISKIENSNRVYQLWKSNGTENGTTLLKSFSSYTNLKTNVVIAGKMYFSAATAQNGTELWVTDGTLAGTILLDDIRTGAASSTPADFINCNNTLFFTCHDGITGREPWSFTPGIDEESKILKDLNPQIMPDTPQPNQLLSLKDKIYFNANSYDEVWTVDETEKEVSFFKGVTFESPHVMGDSIIIFAGKNNLLCKTNGEPGNVEVLSTQSPKSHDNYIPFDNKAYFRVAYGFSTSGLDCNEIPDGSYKIWETNGTADGTNILVSMSGPALSFGAMAKYKGELYYTTPEALRKINPITNEDVMVTAVFPQTDQSVTLRVIGEYLFLKKGWQTWMSDGTANGTIKMEHQVNLPINIKKPFPYTQIGDLFLFTAKHETFGRNLWVSQLNTETIYNIPKIYTSDPDHLNSFPISRPFIINEKVFFIISTDSSQKIWTTDGTKEGTILIKNIPTSGIFYPKPYKIQDKFYFVLQTAEFGNELWVTDGTSQGTHILFDLNEGPASANPIEMTALGDKIVFVATTAVEGTQVWIFDPNAPVEEEPVEEKEEPVAIYTTDEIVEIFPNPTLVSAGQLSIISSLPQATLADISLYTIEGKLVLAQQVNLVPKLANKMTLPLSLNAGTYLINIQAGDVAKTLKLILK